MISSFIIYTFRGIVLPSSFKNGAILLPVFPPELAFSNPQVFSNLGMVSHDQLNYILFGLIFLSICLLVFMTIFLRMKFTHERKVSAHSVQLIRQKEQIRIQAELLNAALEDLQQINQKLEEIDKIRLEKMRAQNESLNSFSFFCSHTLKGPVARVQGLVNILKNTHHLPEKTHLLEILEEETGEISQLISSMNHQLEENSAEFYLPRNISVN